MSMSVNGVINNYTYSYMGKLRPNLDKDDSATWDKTELQNYANAYSGATGNTVDVDKLIEKYANADGVIDYKGQEQMIKDDALGLGSLQSAASSGTQSATSSAASGTGIDKYLTNSLVSNYTYSYKNTFQPALDKNDDGVWGRDELQNYADDLQKATGRTLDVDRLLEQYGDEDGNIDPANQARMIQNDALQLSGLQADWMKANMSVDNTATVSNAASNQTNNDFSLSSLLENMSSSGKMAYSMAIQRVESQQNMLNAFNSVSGASGSGLFDLLNSRSSLQMYSVAMRYGNNNSDVYSAMSGQLMNFTI